METTLSSLNSTNQVNYAQYFDQYRYVNPYGFFYLQTNSFPSSIKFTKVDAVEVVKLIKENFNLKNENVHIIEKYIPEKQIIVPDEYVLKIKDNVMVYGDVCDIYSDVEIIYSLNSDLKVLEELNAIIKKCLVKKENKQRIGVLYVNDDNKLSISKMSLKQNEVSIEQMYNDDFAIINKVILEKLNNNDKGIVLLHGLPGTGKTSYIRYLSTIIDKNFIFIPPDFAYKLSSPSFISLMIENPNSILVIEDAENVIKDRMTNDGLSVANLLNLSDGLLSDCLKIQVICTFNTDISKVDRALLRKGRIIAKYEFGKLTVEKAQILSDMLGLNTKIDCPMTIAELFNLKDLNFDISNYKRVGF